MSESYPYSCDTETRETISAWARERGVYLVWNDLDGFPFVCSSSFGGVRFRFGRPSDEVRYAEEVISLIRKKERAKFLAVKWIGIDKIVTNALIDPNSIA